MLNIDKHQLTPYLLLTIIILAFGLWSYSLGTKSFWTDEVLSIFHAQALTNMSSLVTLQFNNAHPPGFFLLLRFWLLLHSDSEEFTRLLSVLLAIPTIPCIYLIGKHIVSRSVGIFASFLYAIMPLMLIYNREVRMYSMFITLSCISLLLLLKAIEKDRIIYWVLFSLITFVTLSTHYHAFLILIAQGIFLLLYSLKSENRWRLNKSFTLGSSLALLLFLPFVPALIDAVRTSGAMWQSGAKSILVSTGYLIFSLFLGQTVMPWNPVAVVGCIAVLTLCISALWYHRSNRILLLMLVSYGLVVFVIGPIISHNMPRYYLFLVPLICVLLASGIIAIRRRAISFLLSIFLLLSWAVADLNYYAGKQFHIMATVDPWREVAVFLRKVVSNNDKIIVPFTQSLNLYYLPRYGLKDKMLTDVIELNKSREYLPENVWVVVCNPSSTNSGLNIRETLIGKYGYLVMDTERFLRDENYLYKGIFFNKTFAEYRIEVFKLSRRVNNIGK
jgi:4-amino-4-deoxy-L-arabinose transferase-like glycosyltransferase